MRQFIREHITDDIHRLALLRHRFPDIDFEEALAQIEGRQRIREKLPELYADFDWLLPRRLNLEQCSSECTARYKAQVLADVARSLCVPLTRLVDLTGGAGIDTLYCGALFDSVDYVERDDLLCRQAEQNLPRRLSHVSVHMGDSVDYLMQLDHASVILIDPARRASDGRRVAALSDCTPDLTQIASVLTERADIVQTKLSPMLDLRRALSQLPQTFRADIVSVRNECRELLLTLRSDWTPDRGVEVHCVNLQTHEHEFVYTLRA